MPESWNTVIVPQVYDVGPLKLKTTNFNRIYGISITLGNGSQLHNFHYEINLSYTQLTGQQYIVEINKERVYIDDKPAEQIIDEFSEKCGSTLYPLKVLTDANGEFIKILNYEQLQERWSKTRTQLLEYYKGDVVNNLIAAMDSAMSNQAHVTNAIKADWFFSLYFSPLYNIQNKPGSNEGELHIPMLAYTAPLKFAVKQNIDTTPTESMTFEIRQNGVYTDGRSAEDLQKGYAHPIAGMLTGVHTPVKGQAEFKYKLYLADHSISSIVGKSTVIIGTTERLAQIQVYHLREKDAKIKATIPSVLVEERINNPEKKKGFFSFLFS